MKEIRRPDGEDEAEFEPPHGPDTIDSARARREQEAELKRKRELARRAAAAQYDSDDSDGGGGAAGAGAQQPSRIPRSPRPAPQQVPVHSDIEVDSLGDSDDDPFTPESTSRNRWHVSVFAAPQHHWTVCYLSVLMYHVLRRRAR